MSILVKETNKSVSEHKPKTSNNVLQNKPKIIHNKHIHVKLIRRSVLFRVR